MTLQDRLLLTNNGAGIATTEHLGRVLVATCDIKEYSTVVIQESPVLPWKVGDLQGADMEERRFEVFLEAYSAASPEAQRLILDMYHPPQSSSHLFVRRLHIFACSLVQTFPQYTVAFIHKLICISAMHTHKYSPPLIPGNVGESTFCALYSFASKMQFSCHPNVECFSKTGNALAYRAIRPIKKGDSLTFSYLGDLYETPTHERRAKLMVSKFIWCTCERCIAPDYCRVAFCSRCQKYQPCRAAKDPNDMNWTCPLGHYSPEMTKKELGIVRDIEKSTETHQADDSTGF